MDYSRKVARAKRILLSMQRMSWEQGVAAQAFLEYGDKETGLLLAREAVHRQVNGKPAVTFEEYDSVDPGANGIPILYAYELTGDEKYKTAADKLADWFLNKAPRTDEGLLYHNPHLRKTLIDGVYHIAPFLTKAGYPQEALKQIEGFRKIHYNTAAKLYSQYWDDEKKAFEKAAFWGGAQGWVACALARTLRYLPDSMRDEKEDLQDRLQELVDTCCGFQREDGLFHDVMDDRSTFVETTAALMLSFAVYSAVGDGFLDRRYLRFADSMRHAAFGKVDDEGFVQGACGAPYFNTVGTSAEAQAFLMLSEAAQRTAARSPHSRPAW